MALKTNCPTLNKIGDNEEMFVLRAQDWTAPFLVIEWIRENINLAPEHKLREAFECALKMRSFAKRRMPD